MALGETRMHISPRTSEPEGAPALAKSLLVLTVTPVALPDVAGPNFTPLSVMTCDPEATLRSTRKKIKDVRSSEPKGAGAISVEIEMEARKDGLTTN